MIKFKTSPFFRQEIPHFDVTINIKPFFDEIVAHRDFFTFSFSGNGDLDSYPSISSLQRKGIQRQEYVEEKIGKRNQRII